MARCCLSLSMLLIILSSVSIAHDLYAPDWRQEPGSTYQQWSFDSNDNPAAPELFTNLYGDPQADIVLGDYSSGWMDELLGFGSQTGIWDLGVDGSISLQIQNRELELEYKEIWLQVTYYEDGLFPKPAINVLGAIELIDQKETDILEHTEPFGDWIIEKSVWRIYPNPASENIVITSAEASGALIDQIVVDTICIPEPASIVILGMGCVIFLRRFRG